MRHGSDYVSGRVAEDGRLTLWLPHRADDSLAIFQECLDGLVISGITSDHFDERTLDRECFWIPKQKPELESLIQQMLDKVFAGLTCASQDGNF